MKKFVLCYTVWLPVSLYGFVVRKITEYKRRFTIRAAKPYNG